MRTVIRLPYMIVVLLAFISASVYAQSTDSGKYIPKANEEIYGTWVNENASPQKVVRFAGGFEKYTSVADTSPASEGTAEIETKWQDAEGNVWYKCFRTMTAGVFAGAKYQALSKIGKSGTVLEEVNWIVTKFDPQSYPRKIDPIDSGYGIYTRSGN